jgi:hypothetical protein
MLQNFEPFEHHYDARRAWTWLRPDKALGSILSSAVGVGLKKGHKSDGSIYVNFVSCTKLLKILYKITFLLCVYKTYINFIFRHTHVILLYVNIPKSEI